MRDLVLLGAAAVGLIFVGAVFLFGETVLRIDNRRLRVARRPIRFGPAVDVSRYDIQDVIVIGPVTRAWQVRVKTASGVTVIAALETEAQAKCVADVISEALARIEPG